MEEETGSRSSLRFLLASFVHPEKLGRAHDTSSKHKTPVISVFTQMSNRSATAQTFLQGGKVEEKGASPT